MLLDGVITPTLLVSYKNLLVGSMIIAVSCAHASKGEPEIGVSAPVFASTEKTEMFPTVRLTPILLATYM